MGFTSSVGSAISALILLFNVILTFLAFFLNDFITTKVVVDPELPILETPTPIYWVLNTVDTTTQELGRAAFLFTIVAGCCYVNMLLSILKSDEALVDGMKVISGFGAWTASLLAVLLFYFSLDDIEWTMGHGYNCIIAILVLSTFHAFRQLGAWQSTYTDVHPYLQSEFGTGSRVSEKFPVMGGLDA